MKTLNDLHFFMKALAESIPGVEHFAFGDADEIIARERNGSIRYPCVWMETPESTISDEFDDAWMIRLLVIKKASPKDTARVRDARSETQTLIRKLLKRLRHEAEEANDWDMPNGKTKLKPMYVTSDGNAGWYMDVMIEVDQECYTDNDLGVGINVVPSSGGLILIHPASAQRFAVTVDTNGSLITTLVIGITGTTEIPLNDGSTLIINNADGSVATS